MGFRFEDEFVVEEKIEDHSDEGGETENTRAFDERVVEREMDGGRDVKDKFVKRGK